MKSLTVDVLIKKHGLLNKLENMNGYDETICLDDYILEDYEKDKLLSELRSNYPEFDFEIVEVFGGAGHDLRIVNKLKKSAYDKLPKPYTKRDLYREIRDKYGMTSSSMFGANLDERMTEEEYQSSLDLWSKVSSMFDDDSNWEE